ncbi:MAG TPA: heparan-alpha-glucosaminide N-acetyltransferase domain-containing protein [Flavisolibacter sp.]
MEVLEATAPPKVSAVSPQRRRFNSIDLLRGLVMIIMALDHTRDFFHAEAFTDDPLNLQTTSPWLYATRWITHFCAPVFVFLAGTSAWFQHSRKTTAELSRFLVTRGLWLIVVETIIMSFAFTFDPGFHNIFFQTIWAIGISMVLLGVAIWMPFPAILAAGLVIFLGHNLLDYYEAGLAASPGFFYDMLHRGGSATLWNGHTLHIFYPFLPWTGLMLLGYCFGSVYMNRQESSRLKFLMVTGAVLILFFVVLRAVNGYGDPRQWTVQKDTLYTFFSFMNVTKYPPSLLYISVTIGPALFFLAWADKARGKLADIITVFGRVPFFYYILHFYVLHLLCMVLFLARGHSFSEGINTPAPFRFLIPGEGYPLWMVYVIWIAVVATLYPLCSWYSRYKQRSTKWWVSYL